MAKESTKSRLAQKLDAADAAYVQGGDPPPPPSSDPVTRGVNWLANAYESMTPEQRNALGLPTGPTPEWLKTVGRFVIPQTTPEAALMLAMGPWGRLVGGPLARAGVPFATKLAQKGVGAGLGRAAATGVGTGIVGGMTGHDPVESGLLGAGGRMVGETAGVALKNVLESKAAKRISNAATTKVADTFRALIPDWLSPTATPQGVIREVVDDIASKKVGAKINEFVEGMARAKTPVQALDLQPLLDAIKVFKFDWPVSWGPVGPGGLGPAAPGLMPGGVEFAPLWRAIKTARGRLGTTAEDWAAKKVLQEAEDTLIQRANIPRLTELHKEYGKTKELKDLFPEGDRRTFINPDGSISPEGASLLYERLGQHLPDLEKKFAPVELDRLKGAFHWQEGAGLGYPTAGAYPGLRLHVGPGGVSPGLGLEGARLATTPGVEGAMTAAERAAPGAVAALTGKAAAHLPTEVGITGQEVHAAEGPTEPPTVSIPPARLADPYSLNIALPKGGGAPPPAAPKLPSPEASEPQAGMQGAGWFPKFDQPDESDQPEVFLETTKKAGE